MVAEKVAEKAAEAATSDLLTIRSRFFREVGKGKKARLEPVEVTAHLNPVSLAVGAATAVAGALGATVAWHGVSVPNPLGPPVVIFPGLKDTAFGMELRRKFPLIFETDPDLIANAQQHAENQELADEADKIREATECEEMDEKIRRAELRGDIAVAAFWRQEKVRRGCNDGGSGNSSGPGNGVLPR